MIYSSPRHYRYSVNMGTSGNDEYKKASRETRL